MANDKRNDEFPIFLLGVLAGVIAFTGLLLYWQNEASTHVLQQISSTDRATLYAGFGGALLGGLISWLLAWQAARKSEFRERQIQIEREKASALGLFLKAQQIANGYHTHRVYFWEALNRANDDSATDAAMWTKIRPQAGSTGGAPTFVAEEFVPLMRSKRSDLMNDCQLLATRYGSIEASLSIYNQKREALQELMKPHSQVVSDHGRVLTEIPGSEKASFDLVIMELESLIRDIYRHLGEDYRSAMELCESLSKAFGDYFGNKDFIVLTTPPENRP